MTKRLKQSQILQNNKITKLIPTEQDECIAFYSWAQTIPNLKDFLIHIPNEGKRTPWGGKKLLAMGLKPGIPDYFYPVANETFHGLWIEMKRKDPKLHKKNPLQQSWIISLGILGYYATYAYGADHAIKIVTDYMADKL